MTIGFTELKRIRLWFRASYACLVCCQEASIDEQTITALVRDDDYSSSCDVIDARTPNTAPPIEMAMGTTPKVMK